MTSDTQINPADPYGSSDTVWDHARREYLAGVKATTVCQRYGMSLRSFREHARIGGWRRMDRPGCDVLPEPGEYHPDDDVSFADLADEAFLNIRRALGQGRASEASSWMRLYDKLAERARSQVMAELPDLAPPRLESLREPLRLVAADEAESRDFKGMDEPSEATPQELHSPHPVFSECRSEAATP